MIRLIVSDLDNTLCDNAHGLSDKSATYIKKLQEHKLAFMIATGRDYSIVKPLFDVFQFCCPLITLNGAVLYDENGIKQKEYTIPTSIINKINELVKEENIVIWYTKFGNFCLNQKGYYHKLTHLFQDPILQQRFITEHGFVDFNNELSFSTILKEDSVYKVDIYSCTSETNKELRLLSDIQVSSSVASIVEVTAKGISKGKMVLEYCEENDYQKQEVLTFGDSENDMEMLLNFPYGHIMRNADEKLLEKINYIAPSNEQDGVIKVIESFTGIAIKE